MDSSKVMLKAKEEDLEMLVRAVEELPDQMFAQLNREKGVDADLGKIIMGPEELIARTYGGNIISIRPISKKAIGIKIPNGSTNVDVSFNASCISFTYNDVRYLAYSS